MVVTLKFKENNVLYSRDFDELDFKLEDEELAVYREGEFLGYYEKVVGISEDEFLKLVENYIIITEIEVQ